MVRPAAELPVMLALTVRIHGLRRRTSACLVVTSALTVLVSALVVRRASDNVRNPAYCGLLVHGRTLL
jgi:hypothetical protein